jgi:hypothetical protein
MSRLSFLLIYALLLFFCSLTNLSAQPVTLEVDATRGHGANLPFPKLSFPVREGPDAGLPRWFRERMRPRARFRT